MKKLIIATLLMLTTQQAVAEEWAVVCSTIRRTYVVQGFENEELAKKYATNSWADCEIIQTKN